MDITQLQPFNTIAMTPTLSAAPRVTLALQASVIRKTNRKCNYKPSTSVQDMIT